MKLLVLIAVLQLSLAARDSLKPDLYNFISTNFSPTIAALLNRDDKANDNRTWAFGGNAKLDTTYRPVVFVHGFMSMAATMGAARSGFAAKNFNGQRLLATTYGSGETGSSNLLNSNETLNCEFVKQVRKMLEVTRDYYGSKVDVVAQSMGSPIARKAIHGGLCVDDPTQDLGPSMNNDIHTFVSVGGANYGSSLCNGLSSGTCNYVNGLNCNSAFYADINSNTVESVGSYRYTLYSTCDAMIGCTMPLICAKNCGQYGYFLNNVTATYNMGCISHSDLLNGANSVDKQATIVAAGNP